MERWLIVRRTLEAIFRHPIQLLLLLLLPIAVSLVIAYKLPRSYQAAASLWALRRYEIIGATGPESDLLSTPAETQVAALSELLQSRAFALLVAKSTDLASTLNLSKLDPQQRDDALSLEIAQHVLPTSKGYNLYEISYSNRNPFVAQQVVAAVIQEYKQQGQGFSVVEGQHLLEGYQTQLVQAKYDADAAAQAEAQYLAAHPALKQSGATSVNDPQYALLDSKRLQAQATLQNIQSTIATISQQITLQSNGTDTFFQVLDPPILPDASSRTKTFLTVGGVGAGVGLIACVLYILVLVRRDRALYTIHDLQKVSTYPVLMQLPQLPPEMKSHTQVIV
jgi:uncharacterized protein involved in exopolysaccharide biosynthesis